MKNFVTFIILVIVVGFSYVAWKSWDTQQKNICLEDGGFWKEGMCFEIESVIETPETEPESNPSENVQKPDLSQKTERYDITVSIDSLANTFAYDDVYAYAQNQIAEFKGNDVDLSEEEIQFMFFPWTLDITVDTYESERIFTVVARVYQYTGGAHPFGYTKSFHYDKTTGLPITTQDIIPNQDTLYTLAALADKELIVDFPEGSSGDSYDNWNTWYSDDLSVTFIFDPYQIAAYAAGEQEFKVVAVGPNAEMFNQEYFISD